MYSWSWKKDDDVVTFFYFFIIELYLWGYTCPPPPALFFWLTSMLNKTLPKVHLGKVIKKIATVSFLTLLVSSPGNGGGLWLVTIHKSSQFIMNPHPNLAWGVIVLYLTGLGFYAIRRKWEKKKEHVTDVTLYRLSLTFRMMMWKLSVWENKGKLHIGEKYAAKRK